MTEQDSLMLSAVPGNGAAAAAAVYGMCVYLYPPTCNSHADFLIVARKGQVDG